MLARCDAKGDRAAVWGPRKVCDIAFDVRKWLGLAAVEIQEIDVVCLIRDKQSSVPSIRVPN